MQTTFATVIRGFGNNTGIELPPPSLAELGGGKRSPVVVTVADYTYQSVPPPLQAALDQAGLTDRFVSLAYSKRKERPCVQIQLASVEVGHVSRRD